MSNTSTTTMNQDRIINGVNVTKLGETIQAVQQQPELAEFKFRARNTWITGGHNQAEVNSYFGTGQEIQRDEPFIIDQDEPPVLLGEDKGTNPVETLLTALSGCLTTSTAYHGAARGVELESIQSEYEGDLNMQGFLGLNPNIRKGFREIRVKFKVKSDADEATIQELVNMSPVLDMIRNPVNVNVEIEKV